MKRPFLSGLTFVSVLLIAACTATSSRSSSAPAGSGGTSHVTRASDGIITGTLILEYSMGGTGWQGAVFNDPARGRLDLVSVGKVVARVISGTSGAFRVRVPAGRYRFHLADSRRLCATDTPPAPVTLTVRPGRATQVQIFCAAGPYGRRG